MSQRAYTRAIASSVASRARSVSEGDRQGAVHAVVVGDVELLEDAGRVLDGDRDNGRHLHAGYTRRCRDPFHV
jgi:hypothetical protein